MNIIAIVGRLVSDPEMKYTPGGVAVATMRIAVDRRFKSDTGEKVSDFFNVVVWRQSAEFAANYLSKGRLVGVEGRLQSRSWVQNDGQKRSTVEIVAESIQGLDKPKDGEERPPAPSAGPDNDMDYDPFNS